MKKPLFLRLVRIIVCCAPALVPVAAGAASPDPYIAYLYPAGARRGGTVRISVAGQQLKGATAVLVNGAGVSGKIVEYIGANGPLSKLQQEELDRRIKAIAQERRGGRKPDPAPGTEVGKNDKKIGDAPLADLPDLPELRGLERRDAAALALIRDRFAAPNKRAQPPMAETAIVELTIDPDAAAGDRELRLLTPAGLSNPTAFQVASVPEYLEADPLAPAEARPRGPASPPCVLNGRIMPGEEDTAQVALKRGESVVIAVQARNLIPYLADAVPGWFQATVGVFDETGRELAYADDNGPDPDPILRFTAPRDGVYDLKVKDAIYRGRWDFVYRVYVLDEAGAALQFPAGSRLGVPVARVVTPAARPEDAGGPARSSSAIGPGNPGRGIIAAPNERDTWTFFGKAGESVSARTEARRAGSPLDSRLRILDKSGAVLAENDDFADPRLGLSAHQADSRLLAKLPADGSYILEVSDAAGRGGSDYSYDVFLERPAPGFALMSARSALNLLPGGTAELEVRAVRLDGWEGPIAIELDGAPSGFSLAGGTIPADRDRVRLTITAPPKALPAPVELRLRGRGAVSGAARSEPVAPADLRMQAFGNTHLVPASEFLVASARGANAAPRLDAGTELSVKLEAGGKAELTVPFKGPQKRPLIAELVDPPPGLSLEDAEAASGGLVLSFAASADAAPAGGLRTENLIVALSVEEEGKKSGAGVPRRVSLGTLPAIRAVVGRR